MREVPDPPAQNDREDSGSTSIASRSFGSVARGMRRSATAAVLLSPSVAIAAEIGPTCQSAWPAGSARPMNPLCRPIRGPAVAPEVSGVQPAFPA